MDEGTLSRDGIERRDTIGATTAGSDLFDVTWSPPFIFADASILAGSDLRLDVLDDDLTSPDGAFACASEPITAAILRGRDVGCSGAGGELLQAVIVFVP